jgi:hypothetical protein
MINLEDGFTPAPPKEFTTSAPASAAPTVRGVSSVTAPSGIVSVEALQREVAELKLQLASKDARIRQLEAKLEQA